MNEFQAYLMQQPLGYARAYFSWTASRFDTTSGKCNTTAKERMVHDVAELIDAARDLDEFTRSRFGIGAGGQLFVAASGREAG